MDHVCSPRSGPPTSEAQTRMRFFSAGSYVVDDDENGPGPDCAVSRCAEGPGLARRKYSRGWGPPLSWPWDPGILGPDPHAGLHHGLLNAARLRMPHQEARSRSRSRRTDGRSVGRGRLRWAPGFRVVLLHLSLSLAVGCCQWTPISLARRARFRFTLSRRGRGTPATGRSVPRLELPGGGAPIPGLVDLCGTGCHDGSRCHRTRPFLLVLVLRRSSPCGGRPWRTRARSWHVTVAQN
ncbi:hypothetical protein C8Q80DRAFT_450780 [Daedaleopsis nitida]|nr:hypothetical protein C8Q80DRAFT_450780 [Daedaleopsis nitida]